MNLLDQNIYTWFEQTTPYVIAWIALFFIWTSIKIFLILGSGKSFDYKGIKSEFPGFPLTILHSVVWGMSIVFKDPVTFLLFSWWGPGFIVSAYLFLFKKDFPWLKYGKITSYLCKMTYVIYMMIFLYFKLYGLVFVYSVWIIQDQICLIWFEDNADRSRRLLEDKWIFRLGYPLFLLTPFFVTMKFDLLYRLLGCSLLAVWVFSIVHICRKGSFFKRPASYKDFLRNIVYGE